MSRRRRSTQQRGIRREPVDAHAPIKGQLALFGGGPDHEDADLDVSVPTVLREDVEE